MHPIHGTWCNTRTWPAPCPKCKHSVFFFKCDCGSQVFFDHLGWPWPVHDCDKTWAKNLPRTRKADGTLEVQISDGIIARRLPEDFSIEPEIIRAATAQHKKPDSHQIKACHAYKHSTEVAITGILREKTVEANIFKVLDIDPTKPMAVAPLGILGAQRVGRITIHTPQGHPAVLHSYTAWLPSEQILQVENMLGVTVSAHLVPVSALSRETVWHAKRYEILSGSKWKVPATK